MEAPDISNILGQETVKKIYEDGLSAPTKETGKIATDIVKTFRLFLAPIQLAAAYQDRLERHLESVRNAVPETNQIECPPSVAGPVIDRLKYLEDDNYLKDLYLNLLKRAIDRERVNEAHPAFVAIIEQLSPDEALILNKIGLGRFRHEVKMDTIIEIGAVPTELILSNEFPLQELSFVQNYIMYIDHLRYLNLIDTPQYNLGQPDESIEGRPVIIHRYLQLSEFGRLFYKACIE